MSIETPRMEAIEDAAGFIGIEPERMKAAIELFEMHMKRSDQPDGITVMEGTASRKLADEGTCLVPSANIEEERLLVINAMQANPLFLSVEKYTIGQISRMAINGYIELSRAKQNQTAALSGKFQAYKELWISWRANLGDMELRQAHRWVLGVMERFMDEYRDGHLEASYDEIDHFFGLPKAPYQYPDAPSAKPIGYMNADTAELFQKGGGGSFNVSSSLGGMYTVPLYLEAPKRESSVADHPAINKLRKIHGHILNHATLKNGGLGAELNEIGKRLSAAIAELLS